LDFVLTLVDPVDRTAFSPRGFADPVVDACGEPARAALTADEPSSDEESAAAIGGALQASATPSASMTVAVVARVVRTADSIESPRPDRECSARLTATYIYQFDRGGADPNRIC
jgi:hypothetical protein